MKYTGILDKDFVIESFTADGLTYHSKGRDGAYMNEFGGWISYVPKDADIISVSRISDNKVFNIKDKPSLKT